MKIDLAATFKQLGLPLGLVALYSAILGMFDIPVDVILTLAGSLFGTFALIALGIDILKWTGLINDGDAGKWSAAANLAVTVVVTIVFRLYPTFDFTGVDAQIGEFARVAGIVFLYVVQVVGTKGFHLAVTRGLNVSVFSNSSRAF